MSENKLIEGRENYDEFLRSIMDATKKVTHADRCTLWLMDYEKQILWTHISVRKKLDEYLQYIELSLEEDASSIAVKVAKSKQPRNIEYDFYDSEEATVAKELDQQNSYRTCSLLCMPVLNDQGELIGVTQLVNKTRRGSFPEYEHCIYPAAPARWKTEFSKADERRLAELNEEIAGLIDAFNSLNKIDSNENMMNNLAWLTRVSANCLSADRATIFLVNANKTHLWSLIADDGKGGSLEEIEIPIDESLAGEVIKTGKLVKVDHSFHDDPRSGFSKKIEVEIGYHVENILAVPIFNEKKDDIIGVIEFFNKIDPFSNPSDDIKYRIDQNGFEDEEVRSFQRKHAKKIARHVQEFIDFHKILKQYEKLEERHKAERRVTKPGLSEREKLRRLMEEARRITDADRVSLWTVNSSGNSLRGNTISKKGWKDLGTVPIKSKSIVGETALKKKMLNIPCDLYQDIERSKTAREYDTRIQYRTCSLLCVPIFGGENNELVGVLQLVNKKRKGNFPHYSFAKHADKDQVPDCFKASFNEDDEYQIKEFGRTVGTILHSIFLKNEIREMGERFRSY
jgi:GAF domain-containing protein